MEVNHIDFRPSIVPFSLTTIGDEPTDLIICIDRSSSVLDDQYIDQLNAIEQIVNYLSIYLISNEGNLKVALSTFSGAFSLVQSLTGNADTLLGEGLTALNGTEPGGSTKTNFAFRECIRHLCPSINSEARTGVRKVILFTLDGSITSVNNVLAETVQYTNSFKLGTFNSDHNPDSINGIIKMVGITSAADPVYVPGLSGTAPPIINVVPGQGDTLIGGGGVANQDYWFLDQFEDFIDIASSIAEESLTVDNAQVINSGSYTSQSAEQFLDDGTVVPFGDNIQHVEKHSFFVKDAPTNTSTPYLTLNLDENSTGSRILNSSHFGVIVEGVIGSGTATTLFGPLNSIFLPHKIVKFKHTMIRDQNTNTAEDQNQPSWKFEVEENMDPTDTQYLSIGPNFINGFASNPAFPFGFQPANSFPIDPILSVSSEGKGSNNFHSVVYNPSNNTFNFFITGIAGETYIKGTYLLI